MAVGPLVDRSFRGAVVSMLSLRSKDHRFNFDPQPLQSLDETIS